MDILKKPLPVGNQKTFNQGGLPFLTVSCCDCGTECDLWPEQYDAEGIDGNDGDWFCGDCESASAHQYDTFKERDV